MGADGGSIPKRADLVRTRKRPIAERPINKGDAWKYCYLSRQPLTAPIVACSRGKLYNKEAVLKHLLLRTAGEIAPEADPLSHIRGLRDLHSLRLTPNPAFERSTARTAVRAGERTDEAASSFICPVTGKEMNGNFRFGYLRSCGCVLAEVALDGSKITSATEACPQCGAKREPDDFIVLNNREDEGTETARLRTKLDAPTTESRKGPELAQSITTSLPPSRPIPDPYPGEDLSPSDLGGMAIFRKTPAISSLYANNKLS